MCHHSIYVVYMSGKHKYAYKVSQSVPSCIFFVSSPVTCSTSCQSLWSSELHWRTGDGLPRNLQRPQMEQRRPLTNVVKPRASTNALATPTMVFWKSLMEKHLDLYWSTFLSELTHSRYHLSDTFLQVFRTHLIAIRSFEKDFKN